MSEKDNFSDLVGNRSSQSSSSDHIDTNITTNNSDSLDSLDFYDSTDFSDAPEYSASDPDTVDELISVTEVTTRAHFTPSNFPIAGPDDELALAAESRHDHTPHEDHAHHSHENDHRDNYYHENNHHDNHHHENQDPYSHKADYRYADSVSESHDYDSRDSYRHDSESPDSHISRDSYNRNSYNRHSSSRDYDSRASVYDAVRTQHDPEPRPRRGMSMDAVRPVARKTISSASIHGGSRQKPSLATNIISISAFEDEPAQPEPTTREESTSTPEPTRRQPIASTKKKPEEKKKSHHFAIGLLCVIIALIVAGVGIAVAVKLINDQKSVKPTPTAEEPDSTPIITDDNTTLSFLKMENNKKNLVYSPLSIRSGLGLLAAGADGTTKSQIDKVLGSTPVPQYQEVDGELSFANGLFIRDTYRKSVLDSYINTVTDNQNAQLIFGDLTADLLNKWAKDETLGLIDNLGVTPTEETNVVLANALAIKMDWAYQFDKASSKDFYTTGNKKLTAATMSRTFTSPDVYYAKTDTETIATLPLSSKSTANLEFVAIMPSTELSSYVDTLTPVKLQENLKNLTPASSTEHGINVSIPKFKYDYELDFKNDLEKLGIVNAFNPGTANFSKLTTSRLYVNDAVHKANINFSESGIEAAAVTSFSLNEATAADTSSKEPIYLNFDHPFLFLIRDRSTGTPWFTGTVYIPSTE